MNIVQIREKNIMFGNILSICVHVLKAISCPYISHIACNIAHIACNIAHIACNIAHIACNIAHIACNVAHIA